MKSLTAFALVLTAALAGACGSRTPAPPDEAGIKEAEQFRTKHEQDYRKDYVALAGLFFLDPGPNTAGRAPGNAIALPARAAASVGTFVLDGDRVRFEPKPGAAVTLKGQPITSGDRTEE